MCIYTEKRVVGTINNRRDLIGALSTAAELEHALCCAYLYAGFALKRNTDEGGVSWVQLKHMRDWTTNLFLIARQEMEHLSMVCNLLTAIGGAPHFRRPNFPLEDHSYGELPALGLEPFSKATVQRFIKFEMPEYLHLRAELASAIENCNREKALEQIVRRVCAEAHWDYGEVWMPSEGKALECIFACHPAGHGNQAKIESFRQRAMQNIKKDQRLPTDPDLPASAYREARQQRAGLAADSRFEHVREAVALGLNTSAAIPVIASDGVVAVLVFYYETFETLDEDDAVIEMVLKSINEPPDTGPSIADMLAKLPSVTAPAPLTWGAPEPLQFSTIGAFYRQIRKAFSRLDNVADKPLFIGPDQAQVGAAELELIEGWFNVDLFKVRDLESARQAIDKIIEQGEGTAQVNKGCHYERFCIMLEEFESCLAGDAGFQPARPVVSNPYSEERGGGSGADTRLSAPLAVGLSGLFDSAYELTLLLLMRFYAHMNPAGSIESAAALHKISEVAFLPLMTMVIRPLGEMLTTTPAFAGDKDPTSTAGASFEIYSDLDLLPHRQPAWIFFHERLQEMAQDCGQLLKLEGAPERLVHMQDVLQHLAVNIREIATPANGGSA
jgi:hypothetical protein